MMIRRLYRQHTTTVLGIPKMILAAIDLQAGDYVEIEVRTRDKEIRMSKVEGKKEDAGRNEAVKSELDRSGQT